MSRFFLCSDIPLHDCCRVRNLTAQLNLLPFDTDLLVELRKLLVDIRFFFRESLPLKTTGVQYRFRFRVLRVLRFHAG